MTSDQTLARWQASYGNDVQQQPHKAALTEPAPLKAGPSQPLAATSPRIEWGNKSVLLVDSDRRSRESRAKVMRALGVRVDSVADPDAARVRLAAKTYNLVLVDPGRDAHNAESLVEEIRTRNSRQLVRFLVGSPLFISSSLSGSKPWLRRPLAPAPAVAAENLSTPVVSGIDFGQRIRDAEKLA